MDSWTDGRTKCIIANRALTRCTVWETVTKLFNYRCVNCELLPYSQSELTAIRGLRSGRKRNGQREGKVTKRQRLNRMQPLMWKKKRFLCNHISHVPVTLTLSTPCMRAHLEIIVCKFYRNGAICLREEAIFVPAQKCLHHVTFDLDLDLGHILDVQVCKFGRNWAICVALEAICAKSL